MQVYACSVKRLMHDFSKILGTVLSVTALGYGSYIREARAAKQWTQQDLADRMRTSASTISNLEREQHPPTVPDEVNALVIALGLSPDLLLTKMGVHMTPTPAVRLPRDLLEILFRLDAEQLTVVRRLARGLLSETRDRRELGE